MSWLIVSPGNQQPWYCLCRINRSYGILKKGFQPHMPSHCGKMKDNANIFVGILRINSAYKGLIAGLCCMVMKSLFGLMKWLWVMGIKLNPESLPVLKVILRMRSVNNSDNSGGKMETHPWPHGLGATGVWDWDVNSLRPKKNGRRFTDDIFKRIFLTENVRISIKVSLKFIPKCPINNNPALVLIMAWRRSGDKPLSEPMMVSLLTHICVTRPQWVNGSVQDCSNSVANAQELLQSCTKSAM